MRFDDCETVVRFHDVELIAVAEKLRDMESKIALLQEAERELGQQLKDLLAYIELMPLNSEQANQYKEIFRRLYTAVGRLENSASD